MNSIKPESSSAEEVRSRTDSEQIIQALKEGKNKRVRKLLGTMHPAKIAALLELLDAGPRAALWQQLDPVLEGRILPHLNAALRRQLAGEPGDVSAAEPTDAAPGQKPDHQDTTVNQREAIRNALRDGKLKRVGKILQRMHPAKVAGLPEALPPAERRPVWSMVETERTGKVLTYLHDE